MFPTISIPQIVSVYDDLVKAYFGVNRYGGNVAEIYAHRVSEYSTSVHSSFGATSKNGHLFEVLKEYTENAGSNLFSIIELFKEHYPDATVRVKGVRNWVTPRAGLQGGFNHRTHVQVTHPNQTIHGK